MPINKSRLILLIAVLFIVGGGIVGAKLFLSARYSGQEDVRVEKTDAKAELPETVVETVSPTNSTKQTAVHDGFDRRMFDALSDYYGPENDDWKNSFSPLDAQQLQKAFIKAALPESLLLVRRFKPDVEKFLRDYPDASKTALQFSALEKESYSKENFDEIVVSDANAPRPDRVTKWINKEKITVAVSVNNNRLAWIDPDNIDYERLLYATNEITKRTREKFENLESELEQATGIDFEFIDAPDRDAFYKEYDSDGYSLADITIHFKPGKTTAYGGRDYGLSSIERINPDLHVLLNTHEVLFSLSSEAASHHGFSAKGVSVLGTNNSIKRSICNPDRDFFIITGVHEEFLQKCLVSAMGLRGLENVNWNDQLKLLKLLYNPQIQPDMQHKDVSAIIQKILTAQPHQE